MIEKEEEGICVQVCVTNCWLLAANFSICPLVNSVLHLCSALPAMHFEKKRKEKWSQIEANDVIKEQKPSFFLLFASLIIIVSKKFYLSVCQTSASRTV